MTSYFFANCDGSPIFLLYTHFTELTIGRKMKASPSFFQAKREKTPPKIKLVPSRHKSHVMFGGVHFNQHASECDERSWKTLCNWQNRE